MNTQELQTVAIIAKPAGFTIHANRSAMMNLELGRLVSHQAAIGVITIFH